jgi:phosphatidylinositol phosphate synthase
MSPELAGIVVLAALFVSMPAFALHSHRRMLDADVARRPASLLLNLWVRDWTVWLLGPIERWMVRAGVSPDLLNFCGAFAGIAAGVAVANGSTGLAAWLIALGGISDILDGRVARARGLVSRHGAFLDSTLDRFAETGTLVGVALYLSGRPWMGAATALAIAGSLLVSYTRARGEALGVSFTLGLMQRPERVVLLTLGALLDSNLSRVLGWPRGGVLSIAVIVIAIGTVATAVYRTVVISRLLRREDLLSERGSINGPS